MMQHPEQKPEEIYLGNSRPARLAAPKLAATLTTLRAGTVAYDVDGNKLPASEGLVPLFLARAEAAAYDAIMMEEFRNA